MNEETLWRSTLGQLKLSLSSANFQTWFEGKTKIISLKPGLIEIGCNSIFTRDRIEQRHYQLIKGAIDNLTHENNQLIFTVSPQVETKKPAKTQEGTSAPLFEEPVAIAANQIVSAHLNPNYTFATFVVGPNNQLAYAVATAVVNKPATAYNPFFIYGGVGVGKTHLMQSIGIEILRKHHGKKVLYCTSETFMNEMIEAIRNKGTNSFRAKFRGVDVLLIDDIQFIAGRDTTQEEFFHTFNDLHGSGKQIVMTSDRPPKDIAKLEERLRSRFEGGMMADIQIPDVDMREAILKSKAAAQNLAVGGGVMRYLAENIVSSVRDLEGSLLRVITAAQITHNELTVDFAKTIISGASLVMSKRAAISPRTLIKTVCGYFDLKEKDLLGKGRSAYLVTPRQIAMYIMREELGLKYLRVAEELGKKDHTTIMHGVEKVRTESEKNSELRGQIADIKDILYRSK